MLVKERSDVPEDEFVNRPGLSPLVAVQGQLSALLASSSFVWTS